ncbi:MAG: cytochrome c biogenesis protein CcdA [Ktedonobacterales bacterium]
MQPGLGTALLAFAGGLLSFFSPCVAPLVPGYISYISSLTVGTEATTAAVGATSAGGSVVMASWRQRLAGPAARASLLFVAGFSLAFIGLGMLSASFGRLLAPYLPVMQTLTGIVMLVMGTVLLGLLPKVITEPLMRETRLHLGTQTLRGWGIAAPLALGVLFAAGWTPCIGPVLASILFYVETTGNMASGAGLLAMYSLGFAIPFLSIGMGWSVGLRALGWAKRYGNRIAQVSGVALILLSLLYLTGEVTVISSWAQRFAIL